MILFKLNNYNKKTKKRRGKILLVTLLFIFSSLITKALNFSGHISKIYTNADTLPKKGSYTYNSALILAPFPSKTTCDPDFNAAATGGDNKYIYSSSNALVATINSTTGLIHMLASGGTTLITVDDPTASPPGSVSQTLTVTIPTTPSVTISPLNYPISCLGTFVTYTATAVNAGVNPTYSWYENGTYIPGPLNNVLKLSTLPSGAIITCVVTDNTDVCVTNHMATSNAATLTVYPYTTPQVTITQSPPGVVTSGTAITFTAAPGLSPQDNAPYSLSYQWNLNGNPIANATEPTYTSACSHNDDSFTCTITPTGVPCLTYQSVTSASQRVSISNENTPITAQITASENGVYKGTYIFFDAELIGDAKAVSYLWQINGIDTNVFTPEFKTYSLKNNDEVRCVIFTNNGCTPVVISDPIKMIIYPTPDVVIPNTFTPNGDGINDVWEIKYLELYRNSSIKIFNRYGALLYHSKGYNTPWDGTYNGKEVPVGTYYYVIDLGVHTPNLAGPVTVIR